MDRDLETRLHQALFTRFSQPELRTLCFDLGVDYDDLPGEGKSNKARELVTYMRRRDRLDDLAEAVQRARPDAVLAWEPDASVDLAAAIGRKEAALDSAERILAVIAGERARFQTAGPVPADTEQQWRDQRRQVAKLRAELEDLKLARDGVSPRKTQKSRLPEQAPFFGREAEIEQALESFNPRKRMWGVLIDGLGGMGKTALALKIAHESQAREAFQDYVWVSAKTSYLEPTGIRPEKSPDFTSAGTLFDAIAEELELYSIHELSSDRDKRDALHARLEGRETLLVLVDNLETLKKKDQQEVIDFLSELPPGCKAIVTTRERYGHRIGGASIVTARAMPWEDALRLIEVEAGKEQRVQAVLEEQVGRERWRELYEAAGGSPLAIIWAIGLMRVRHKTFDEALEMLRQGEREGDMYRFIYHEAVSRLDRASVRLLDTLALFLGPATPEALKQVSGLAFDEFDRAREELANLSFLMHQDQGRFTLHPITRRYVGDLETRRDQRELPLRYARYWRSFAEEHGYEKWESYPRLRRDLDDVRSAVLWTRREWVRLAQRDGTGADGELGWARRVWRFLRRPFSARDEPLPEEQVELALMLVQFGNALSTFYRTIGYWTWLEELCHWAIEAAGELGEGPSLGWRCYDLGWLHAKRGALAAAREWAEKASAAFKQGGSREGEAEARRLQGVIAEYAGDLETARAIYKQVLKVYKEAENNEGIGMLLLDFGDLARARGNLERAQSYYEHAQSAWLRSESPEDGVAALNRLGLTMLEMDRYEEAELYFKQAWESAIIRAQAHDASRREDVVYSEELAEAQWGLARIEAHQGQPERALQYAQEALRVYQERLGKEDVAELRRFVRELQEQVGGNGQD